MEIHHPRARFRNRAALFLCKLLDSHVAETDGAMVALEEYRSGLVYIPVDLATGRAFANDVVVNLRPVEYDGNLVPDDGDFRGLPTGF